jgi:hypothetical protein
MVSIIDTSSSNSMQLNEETGEAKREALLFILFSMQM